MGVLHVFFLALENFIPSKASEILSTEGKGPLILFFKKLVAWGAIIIIVICLFIFLVSDVLVDFIYGEDYVKYAYLLNWFMALYLINYFLLVFRYHLRTIEKTRPIFIGYIIGAVFNFLTAKLFITYLGLNGIVIGLITMQCIVLLFYIKKGIYSPSKKK